MPEYQSILQQPESETLQFKERFNADVIERAVTFANTRGGRIIIGFSDDGTPTGVNFRKEVLRDYVNQIATATEPLIMPAAEEITDTKGQIIALFVTEFPLKPVSTRGRCYRRSGSTTRQMTPSKIAELHMHSTGQSMDAVIVRDKTQDDLKINDEREKNEHHVRHNKPSR